MKKRIVLIVISMVILLVGLSGCETSQSEQQRIASVNTRTKVMSIAEAQVPVPVVDNFPLRKALAKYTQREAIDHPYYVYVFADTGAVIGYYVSKTMPVSTNAFMSSTENVVDAYDTSVVLTAPSLDGIYYGGSGSSAGSGWFIFDQATDALIIIYGLKIFVSDQPLAIKGAEPIAVNMTK